jgi:hypothetical protein
MNTEIKKGGTYQMKTISINEQELDLILQALNQCGYGATGEKYDILYDTLVERWDNNAN